MLRKPVILEWSSLFFSYWLQNFLFSISPWDYNRAFYCKVSLCAFPVSRLLSLQWPYLLWMLISCSLHWGGLVNLSSDKLSVLPFLLSGTFFTEQVGLNDGVSQVELDNFKWPVLRLIILSSPSSLCWASVPVWVSVAVALSHWPKQPDWGKCFLGFTFTLHHQEKTGQDSKQELEGWDLSRGHRECCFLAYLSCFLIQHRLPVQGWHHPHINHSLGNHPNGFTHRSVSWRQFNWWVSHSPGDYSLTHGDKS